MPYAPTHCRFRNALVHAGVYDQRLAEICRQIETHGLKLKQAEAAIIDANLIKAAARPHTHRAPTSKLPRIREEEDADETSYVHDSADKEARWVKKGSKSTLGFKGFSRTDEEGFIDKVHVTPANDVTPANVGESPQFGTMIEGS